MFPAGPLTNEAITVKDSVASPESQARVVVAEVAVAVSAVYCAAVADDNTNETAFDTAVEADKVNESAW